METHSKADALQWVSHQRSTYARRYKTFRALHEFLRYDVRYRVFLMEELFRRFDLPFERQRVFELGFGSGTLLLRFDSSSELHGSELSEGAVDALAHDPKIRGYKNARFVVSRPDGIPNFPSADYDIVIASHVLEHAPDDEAVLHALATHTKAGGHALFFLPLERPRHNPDHARVYTAAGFKRLLRQTGFEPIHCEENFRYASHWVQVVNWPSRARIPVLGPLVEALKTTALALMPTSVVKLLERPLERLYVAPYQLAVLARRTDAVGAVKPNAARHA